MAIAVAICTDHVLWGAGTPRTLRTFMRWVYLCMAGIGNHVLLDEAKVTPLPASCEKRSPHALASGIAKVSSCSQRCLACLASALSKDGPIM